MDQERREFIRIASALSVALGAGILLPSAVLAKEGEGNLRDAKTVKEAVNILGGDLFIDSTGVILSGPEMVDSGYVVPVSMESRIPGTDFMALMIQKNPVPMSAVFLIPPGTEAMINTRIKMGATSTVYGIVRANGNFYVGSTMIKVRAGGGGCG